MPWSLTGVKRLKVILPRSITTGAFGPTSIATAPAPPVLRALPAAYTAMSAATTIASRPAHQNQKKESGLCGRVKNYMAYFSPTCVCNFTVVMNISKVHC